MLEEAEGVPCPTPWVVAMVLSGLIPGVDKTPEDIPQPETDEDKALDAEAA